MGRACLAPSIDIHERLQQLPVRDNILIDPGDQTANASRGGGGAEKELGRLPELVTHYQLQVQLLVPFQIELEAANRLSVAGKCERDHDYLPAYSDLIWGGHSCGTSGKTGQCQQN